SRRRHTRWPRDWSSDVCSSDLVVVDVVEEEVERPEALLQARLDPAPLLPRHDTRHRVERKDPVDPRRLAVDGERRPSVKEEELRSEERRVGKEGRCRWWGDGLR